MAIAEADIFGDRRVIDKYGINQSTLWRWRDRENSDAKLHENALLKRRMLLIDWQQDATKCLKVGLDKLTAIIPVATKEDADVIHAIAGAMKIVGELRIAHDALSDDE